MIKIEAIIRNSVLHSIKDALSSLGIITFSAYPVELPGIQRGHKGWRNKTSDFIPKTKIEILCSNEDEDKIVDAIRNTAKTGEKGDGIIFTHNIDNIVKIRTGQTGADAIK